MRLPRLVIAGTHSGCGKTTVTVAVLAALRRRGWRVQPWKVGPDFIDPGYHAAATGRPGRNVDTWMVPPAVARWLFARGSRGADLAIVEGVMGLYDGRGPGAGEGSTAEVARELRAPVVLVVDGSGLAQSAGALVLGYHRLDPGLPLAGVIANRVGSTRHLELIAQAVEGATGLPVLGGLPREPEVTLPTRHLGLVPVAERDAGPVLGRLADLAERHLDLNRLLELARAAPPLPPGQAPAGWPPDGLPRRVRVGVARDEAFHFYYPESLELLAAWGAEPLPFSPLRDPALPPDVDGLWLGGGFPEAWAARLAANRSLRAQVAAAARAGMPIYAECGGLMYLGRAIEVDGCRHAMAGVLPLVTALRARPVGLGYREVEARVDTPLLGRGQRARGHEFHYSEVVAYEGGGGMVAPVYRFSRGTGPQAGDGYAVGNVLAAYTHLYLPSCPQAVGRFVGRCAAYRERRTGMSGRGVPGCR